jgi:hypothetical protein
MLLRKLRSRSIRVVPAFTSGLGLRNSDNPIVYDEFSNIFDSLNGGPGGPRASLIDFGNLADLTPSHHAALIAVIKACVGESKLGK